MRREITHDDILGVEAYAKVRDERRGAVREVKRNRRLEVGPVATFYFENYDTMWHQVHEMLYIEKGGEEQVEDELRAYNPLIPNGAELVATVMFEIDDPVRRDRVLSAIGGVDETITLSFAGDTVKGVPEADVERTDASGRASSVHFIHFPFTADQIAKFRKQRERVVVAINHPAYEHMTVMPEAVRAALAKDFA